MKVAVFAYSRQGCKTARRVMEYFHDAEVKAYTMARFEEEGFAPLERPSKPFYGPIFEWADAMVFVGSTGIAVREIAPFVKDKRTDPAVISMDELGTFVIPLLSGHIGGANELALKLAEVLEATPVITTATDINKKFSVDAWAGLFIALLIIKAGLELLLEARREWPKRRGLAVFALCAALFVLGCSIAVFLL